MGLFLQIYFLSEKPFFGVFKKYQGLKCNRYHLKYSVILISSMWFGFEVCAWASWGRFGQNKWSYIFGQSHSILVKEIYLDWGGVWVDY